MADERNYYVLCENNCKFPAMTKEQILAAITQAVENGEIKDVDTGFVTKIQEQNTRSGLSFWIGTQAEYNAIENPVQDCFYIITDDATADDLKAVVVDMQKQVEEMQSAVGVYVVEQGTAETEAIQGGVWTWFFRKWNDGKMELWGTSATKTLKTGNEIVRLPVGFVNEFSYFVDGGAIVSDSIDGTPPTINVFAAGRAASAVQWNFSCDVSTQVCGTIHAVGNWK